ncbi:MAG TPA: hypothetical protein VGC21_08820, partial [Telluria sp.]
MINPSRLPTWIPLTIGALLTAFGCATAQAAGIASVTVPAAGAQPALQAMVWSPCSKADGPVELGIFTLQGVSKCDVAGDALPLIVISHGKGGSLIGHHDTANALANAGFVVATLNHPGDSFGDDAASDKLDVFSSRPRDVRRLISFMTTDWQHRKHLNASAIGVFGFSRGGYTALNLIGAVPDAAAAAQRFCDGWWTSVFSMCRQLKAGGADIGALPDARIRAAVVVDPLNLFGPASFRNVHVPVQLWASELGGDGVQLAHIEAVKAQLPQMPEFHVARGAGHFAYLAPCPAALAQSAKEICADTKGFDRVDWHKNMNASVLGFFQKNLP